MSTTLADQMKRVRLARGLSVLEMSRRLGKSENYWRNYEDGKRRPSSTTLAHLMIRVGLTDREVLLIVHAIASDVREVEQAA